MKLFKTLKINSKKLQVASWDKGQRSLKEHYQRRWALTEDTYLHFDNKTHPPMGVKYSRPGTQTRHSFAWDARTSWARCLRWLFKTLEITFLARLTLIIFLQMNQHLKLAHPKDGETNPVESPCGECGKNFQSKSALKFHIDTQHNNDISFAFWKYKILLNPFW